jgi:hypothetical protein
VFAQLQQIEGGRFVVSAAFTRDLSLGVSKVFFRKSGFSVCPFRLPLWDI